MRKHQFILCSLPFSVIFNINNVRSKSQTPLETRIKQAVASTASLWDTQKFTSKLRPSLYIQSKYTQHGGSFSFRRNLALVCHSFSICIVFEALCPLGRFASYFGRRLDLIFLNGMLLSVSHYLGNVELLAGHGLLAYPTVWNPLLYGNEPHCFRSVN